jgi:hypothetical protein
MRVVGYLLLMVIPVIGCKKPYNPPATAAKNSYLVVEGVINAGADSTNITLSRTVNLSSKTTVNPELHAIVAIQSDQNVTYPLTETTKGNYVCAGLNLSSTHNYRLSVKTSNNEEYLSDYVPVKNSPPIDSVTYDTKGNSVTPGLNVFVNTHDPKNNTTYYRWEYQETWIIYSSFNSQYVSNGDTILPRPISDQIYQCWQTDSSSTIIVNSSAKLASDVIANNPIAFVNSTSEKLANGYSILVRQFALTADAYTFWTNLKKNTEQLGSIFDAQPSQINGNIHCTTNPAEPVIGYLSIGIPSTQRIFIENRVLPAWLPINSQTCPLNSFTYSHAATNLGEPPVNWVDKYLNYDSSTFTGPLYLPTMAEYAQGSNTILGYDGSTPICVDCTLRGTNKQPAFWKY